MKKNIILLAAKKKKAILLDALLDLPLDPFMLNEKDPSSGDTAMEMMLKGSIYESFGSKFLKEKGLQESKSMEQCAIKIMEKGGSPFVVSYQETSWWSKKNVASSPIIEACRQKRESFLLKAAEMFGREAIVAHLDKYSPNSLLNMLAQKDSMTAFLSEILDPNNATQKSMTAELLGACASEKEVELLTKKGFDLLSKDKKGQSGLDKVLSASDSSWKLSVAASIVLNGGKEQESEHVSTETSRIIFFAAKNKSKREFARIYEALAPNYPDFKNKNGETPLMAALGAGNFPVASFLLKKGAKATKENQFGTPAFVYAFLGSAKAKRTKRFEAAEERFYNFLKKEELGKFKGRAEETPFDFFMGEAENQLSKNWGVSSSVMRKIYELGNGEESDAKYPVILSLWERGMAPFWLERTAAELNKSLALITKDGVSLPVHMLLSHFVWEKSNDWQRTLSEHDIKGILAKTSPCFKDAQGKSLAQSLIMEIAKNLPNNTSQSVSLVPSQISLLLKTMKKMGFLNAADWGGDLTAPPVSFHLGFITGSVGYRFEQTGNFHIESYVKLIEEYPPKIKIQFEWGKVCSYLAKGYENQLDMKRIESLFESLAEMNEKILFGLSEDSSMAVIKKIKKNHIDLIDRVENRVFSKIAQGSSEKRNKKRL